MWININRPRKDNHFSVAHWANPWPLTLEHTCDPWLHTSSIKFQQVDHEVCTTYLCILTVDIQMYPFMGKDGIPFDWGKFHPCAYLKTRSLPSSVNLFTLRFSFSYLSFGSSSAGHIHMLKPSCLLFLNFFLYFSVWYSQGKETNVKLLTYSL